MRILRKLGAASVITLMLALPALAGEIQTGIAAPPPPTTQAATTQGEISTTMTVALNLLQGVLTLI